MNCMPFIRIAPLSRQRGHPPDATLGSPARTVNALELNLALDGQYEMLAVGGHDDEIGRGRCPAGG
jgi:hypothetical protein